MLFAFFYNSFAVKKYHCSEKYFAMKTYANLFIVFVFLYFPLYIHAQDTQNSGCIFGDCGNGWGTYIFNNGKYTGEWKNGKLHGYGTFKWNNGDKYDGSWTDGKRNDSGTFIWADGSKFIGTWKDDKRNGAGVYFDKSGRMVKQGNWYNNEYYRKLYGKVMACKLFISNYWKINVCIKGSQDSTMVNSDHEFILEFSEKIKNPVVEFSSPVIFSKTFEVGKDTTISVCLNPRYHKGILAVPIFGPVFYGRSINKNYILTAAFTDVLGILALTYGLISYGEYDHNTNSYNTELERYSTLTNSDEINASHEKLVNLYNDINHSWNKYIAGTVTGSILLASSIVIRIIAIASPNSVHSESKGFVINRKTHNQNISILPVYFVQDKIQSIGLNIHF